MEVAQERVNNLLAAQKRLRLILGSTALLDIGTGSCDAGSAKVPELRQLLGRAVRAQTEQQLEIESLRIQVREERTRAFTAKDAATVAATQTREMHTQVEQLQMELADERNERMESEAAAMEREEQLQARVEDLEAQERRRLEIEKAMEEAEPPPAPPSSIQVQATQPPPPVSGPGFDVTAGGFSL